MNHPTPEDCALYASGELDADQHRSIADHLSGCPECATHAAGLQRTAHRLRTWNFPALPELRRRSAAPLAKWSIAAALVLGAGVAIGRFSTEAQHSRREMRVALEHSLKASLAEEWRTALREITARSEASLASLETRLAKRSDEQMSRAIRGVVEAMSSVREEDRDSMRILIETMRQQHDREIRSLRVDLETVATRADAQLRFAHYQLRQLSGEAGKKQTSTPQ